MEMKVTKNENGENVLVVDNITIQLTDDIIKQIKNTKIKEVVGYKFSVNGVEHKEDWWGKNEIFQTQHDVNKGLNFFGYGGGITKKDTIEVFEVKDYDKSKYSFHKVSYHDDIDELCPHCGNDVSLKRIFANQICPECGALISPCSLCDYDKCDCKNCPLQKTLFTI